MARKLKNAPYRRAQRTSISGAIDAAAKMFEGNGFDSSRLVIDVSGDGRHNQGRPPGPVIFPKTTTGTVADVTVALPSSAP